MIRFRNVNGAVESQAIRTDIDFRYGYSIFDFEYDGFRLGPAVAIGYTDISLKLAEPTIAGTPTGTPTGTRASYEDTFPIPTIGAHAVVSSGNFLFSTQLGGFYADTGDWEVAGLRAKAGFHLPHQSCPQLM